MQQMGQPHWPSEMAFVINEYRASWRRLNPTIPETIRYGLEAEYHHANATWASLDDTLSPRTIKHFYEDYVEFRDNLPPSFLVGAPSNYLVANVAKTWDSILEKHPDIVPVPARFIDTRSTDAAPTSGKGVRDPRP